jgi:hypothetical protein
MAEPAATAFADEPTKLGGDDLTVANNIGKLLAARMLAEAPDRVLGVMAHLGDADPVLPCAKEGAAGLCARCQPTYDFWLVAALSTRLMMANGLWDYRVHLD